MIPSKSIEIIKVYQAAMLGRNRDKSFAAFSTEAAGYDDPASTWNEAAFRVVDRTRMTRVLAGISTISYTILLATAMKFVNTSLIIYGDPTALITTVASLLPIAAGVSYIKHQSRLAARSDAATINGDTPNEVRSAQHPSIYRAAKSLKKKGLGFITTDAAHRYQI